VIEEPTPRREEMWARPECPDVARWTAPDGVATETEVSALLAALVRALKPDLVIETGAYLGHTTEAIGRALQTEGRGQLVTFEIAGDRAAHVAVKCVGLPVIVMPQDSRTWRPATKTLDLLFVDSEYAARVEEVRWFHGSASPRCVVVAHDTVMGDYRKALEELVAENIVTPWVFLPTPRGLAIARYRS
jgi:predicted O-methyltransferase YrrM